LLAWYVLIYDFVFIRYSILIFDLVCHIDRVLNLIPRYLRLWYIIDFNCNTFVPFSCDFHAYWCFFAISCHWTWCFFLPICEFPIFLETIFKICITLLQDIEWLATSYLSGPEIVAQIYALKRWRRGLLAEIVAPNNTLSES